MDLGLSYQVLALLLAFSALVNLAFGAQSQLVSQQLPQAGPTPFPVCIDDSDCIKLGKGDKFACFQVHFWYIWYIFWYNKCV